MLQRLTTLRGATVHALDGDLGSVDDFYFDDELWVVRYVSVDTGTWLPGRRVVLSVMSIMTADWESGRLPVKLARDQIRDSPDVLSHPEVSRVLESQLLSYYGYPYYWAGDALWGTAAHPALAAEASAGLMPPRPARPADDEHHLHSVKDVTGYHIHARDGEIGHIDDFLINRTDWGVDAILVDTSNWIGGRWVAIAPSSIGRIDWAGRHIRVNLSCKTLLTTPEYDPDARARAHR
jgi:hypothetical protein